MKDFIKINSSGFYDPMPGTPKLNNFGYVPEAGIDALLFEKAVMSNGFIVGLETNYTIQPVNSDGILIQTNATLNDLVRISRDCNDCHHITRSLNTLTDFTGEMFRF